MSSSVAAVIFFFFLLFSGLPIISSQEKYQTTTQGSDCLTFYASSLKELYTSMAQSHTSQHWSHLPRCEFIQLAMIKDDQVRRGGPEEERVRLAQQGKIEVIMCQKEEIDLTNIFLPPKSQPPPPPPPSPSLKLPISHQAPKPILSISILPPLKRRVILIEGAPGGGKSTLAVHICHMWAQGAFFLANFNMVILAYLRDEAIQNASTLANILPADVTKVSQSSSDIATEIKASYGFKVLFIFDGWDEFPPELQNNSLISTIIREPHKLCLQQSTVLITTRPVASGNLLHIADQRVEILGFTPHQIREYIEKALNGDSTRIQKLVQHLEEHPVIEGYCYIPLHVAILVHIFLTRKEALPTTRHELFRDLVLCCIVRELETHKSDQNVKTEISSFKDLPHVIKSQLNDLCLLAYNGVTQNEVVFYRKHLQVLHLPSNLPSLGLLQAVEGLTRFSKSLSYNFLHLSVQELLAAYNISQLKSSKQVKVFKSLFGSFRFQPVLHSFCGFTKLENPAIRDYISANLRKSSSFKELLPFLHCFFEAQQPTLCQLVSHKFRKLVVNSSDLSPADHLAVGYFITSLMSTSSATDESVELELVHANEHCLKLLLCEIVKCQKPVNSTLSTKLVLKSIALKSIALSFNQLTMAITHIDFSNNQALFLNSEEAHHIIQACQHNLTTLVFLNLSNTGIGNSESGDIGQALAEMLQVNKSLKHIDLSVNDIFKAPSSVFQSLQYNSTLVHLNLSSTGISACDVPTKTLSENRTLQYLDLSGNVVLSDAGAHSIFQYLQVNTTLLCLDLRNTGITAEMEILVELINALTVNRTLKHLDVSQNKFTSIAHSSQYLKQITGNSQVHLKL